MDVAREGAGEGVAGRKTVAGVGVGLDDGVDTAVEGLAAREGVEPKAARLEAPAAVANAERRLEARTPIRLEVIGREHVAGAGIGVERDQRRILSEFARHVTRDSE
jgi:hypothetical protein